MYYYSIGMYVYVCVCILLRLECIQPDMEISEPSLVHMLQDYAFFIPPPQFYAGKRSRFSPSLDECWYGRVALLFRVHVRRDDGALVECDCAMMETLWDYCPGKTEPWWPSTAQIGTKMLYLPKPRPRVWIVPLSSLLGRLPLIPAGDTGTIPHSMHGMMDRCYPGGECDKANQPGKGSTLFYINSWAMVFPSDHPAE